MSRASFRFGDITDSEDLFETIRDSDFRDDSGFGVDIGVLWTAESYQRGAEFWSRRKCGGRPDGRRLPMVYGQWRMDDQYCLVA